MIKVIIHAKEEKLLRELLAGSKDGSALLLRITAAHEAQAARKEAKRENKLKAILNAAYVTAYDYWELGIAVLGERLSWAKDPITGQPPRQYMHTIKTLLAHRKLTLEDAKLELATLSATGGKYTLMNLAKLGELASPVTQGGTFGGNRQRDTRVSTGEGGGGPKRPTLVSEWDDK